MANGDDSSIHLIHTLWSAALSGLGGLFMWNWARLSKQIDGKLDKDAFEIFTDSLKSRWALQDQMHRDNVKKLSDIAENLAALNGRLGNGKRR